MQFSATGIETTADIVNQPASWYSHFSNRYVSLVGVTDYFITKYENRLVHDQLFNSAFHQLLVCDHSFRRLDIAIYLHRTSDTCLLPRYQKLKTQKQEFRHFSIFHCPYVPHRFFFDRNHRRECSETLCHWLR